MKRCASRASELARSCCSTCLDQQSYKKDAQRDDINYLGSFGGLLAQSPSNAGSDEAPPAGDIATAQAFGQRIAIVTRDLLR